MGQIHFSVEVGEQYEDTYLKIIRAIRNGLAGTEAETNSDYSLQYEENNGEFQLI